MLEYFTKEDSKEVEVIGVRKEVAAAYTVNPTYTWYYDFSAQLTLEFMIFGPSLD